MAAIPSLETKEPAGAWASIVADWSSDRQAFKVPWGKAMMWIFLLSDTFIFSCFLTGYMTVRISTTDQWPNPSEVFAGGGYLSQSTATQFFGYTDANPPREIVVRWPDGRTSNR